MTRIIYGVCGEGMGHAMRSTPIIEHLSKKHRLKIFSSGRAYLHLKKKFKDVNETGGLYIKYRKDRVDKLGTLLINISSLPSLLKSLAIICREINKFKPDLVVSDFEIISSYAALLRRIPTISIDNQHITGKVKLKFPLRFLINFIETRIVNRLIIIHAKYYFITSFFFPEPKSGNVFLVPPILREGILKIKPSKKDYVLVYQTSDSNKKLIDMLGKIGENFVVYGFNMEKDHGTVKLRKFSNKRFFDDLANCKALITNGGFTLISEALYLKKPILSIPVRRQFEQINNAIHLDRLGYGRYLERADKEKISEFIGNLDFYTKKLRSYKVEDNSRLFKKLDSVIGKLV